MEKTNLLKGCCHCGNIQYSLKTKIQTQMFSARVCSCTFCVKHGGRYISDPNGEMTVCIRDRSRSIGYEFGTKTAKFIICSQCGTMPVIVGKMGSRYRGVVNCNTLDETYRLKTEAQAMDFSSEDLQTRLKRRERSWIGKVEGVSYFFREDEVFCCESR